MFLRNLSKILMLILLFVFLKPAILVSAEESSNNVVFIDSRLEYDVRYLLNKPDGPITKDDMKELTILDDEESSIEDLTGLEYAVNLKTLDILHTGGPSKLSDLSPLRGLINLEDLEINSGSISDITPISNLINLQVLCLPDNNISSLDAISGLSKLVILDISNPNSKVPMMQNLGLLSNEITDITPLSNLNNLVSINLNSNEIEDISPISGLTSLRSLSLIYNKISDITPLKNMTSLEKLNLVGNQIEDISVLKNILTNMTYLNLGENKISNIDVLVNSSELDRLTLHCNPISSIESIKNNLNLTYLDIGNTNVTDLSPLANFNELGWLNISHIDKDFTDLSRGEIKDITPIKNATKLYSFQAKRNKIEDISVLSNLNNLNYVDLDDNMITDISPVFNNFINGGLKGCYFDITRNDIDISEGSSQLEMLRNLWDNDFRIWYDPQAYEIPPTINSSSQDGSFQTPQEIVLSSPTWSVIYYTLDGTTPTINSKVYTGPIKISATTTLKAIAVNLRKQSDVLIIHFEIVTSVSLNKASDTLTVGNTDTLTATVAPTNATNKAVIWTTSDTSIAAVDNTGKITAVGSGTATIKASTLDGGYTATCIVIVKSNEKPVISGASDRTIKVGDSFDIKAGVTASDTEDGNLTSKIVVSGSVDITKPGQYPITYTVTDNDGHTVIESKTISVVARNVKVVSLIGSNRYDTAAKLSQSQFITADTIIIVNGEAMADGLGATPLAKYKNAPLLLTDIKSLPNVTINEIKRLQAKNAFIVGGTGVVSDDVKSQLQALGLTVVRISGSDRCGTSLAVAKYIDQNYYDVSKIVIANGYGEADALSIASAAGRDNMPIILVDKDNVPAATYDWLASESIENAYIIGGTGVVSDNVLNKIDEITVVNVRDNRLGGKDRFETNSLVIDRFYGSVINMTYIAKGYELIDALAAGPVAAINGAPVVLTDKDLTTIQKATIDKRHGDTIIRTGGGISDTAVNSLKNCLQ